MSQFQSKLAVIAAELEFETSSLSDRLSTLGSRLSRGDFRARVLGRAEPGEPSKSLVRARAKRKAQRQARKHSRGK